MAEARTETSAGYRYEGRIHVTKTEDLCKYVTSCHSYLCFIAFKLKQGIARINMVLKKKTKYLLFVLLLISPIAAGCNCLSIFDHSVANNEPYSTYIGRKGFFSEEQIIFQSGLGWLSVSSPNKSGKSQEKMLEDLGDRAIGKIPIDMPVTIVDFKAMTDWTGKYIVAFGVTESFPRFVIGRFSGSVYGSPIDELKDVMDIE